MAAVLLFWDTNMAAVTSCENIPWSVMLRYSRHYYSGCRWELLLYGNYSSSLYYFQTYWHFDLKHQYNKHKTASGPEKLPGLSRNENGCFMTQMSHESWVNESMSQIWKNKSFGRNNKIKHYFYLICLLASLLPAHARPISDMKSQPGLFVSSIPGPAATTTCMPRN